VCPTVPPRSKSHGGCVNPARHRVPRGRPINCAVAFHDICLQDKESNVPARCPQGNCVTAKIDEYARRLHDGDYDKWGASGDLAFLIHFVGDIHQPLHTTTNADRGGTCQRVNVAPAQENLHYAWDDAVVALLEKQLGTSDPGATARKLEAL
jgi:S1/P1 Nuclease